MTRTEELIARSQAGDKSAGEDLITENAGLIWSVARRFLGRGAEADDLYQLGCLGFLKAVEGFDLSFGTQFSTYAVPKISGEIRRFLRDDGAIKVSRSSVEDIAFAETATSVTESISRETGEDGFTLENILSNTESEEAMVEKISLRQAICNLSEREATVIRLRYFHGLTQQRVAGVLAVSQVQVSRIEKKAISRLRQLME